MQRPMVWLSPLMIVYFALKVPAGLGLYWFVGNLVSIIQQYFVVGTGNLFPKRGGGGPAQAVVAKGGGGPQDRGTEPRPETAPQKRAEARRAEKLGKAGGEAAESRRRP